MDPENADFQRKVAVPTECLVFGEPRKVRGLRDRRCTVQPALKLPARTSNYDQFSNHLSRVRRKAASTFDWELRDELPVTVIVGNYLANGLRAGATQCEVLNIV
ncbi:uncharacterized protein Bfra_004097 [Botrytis fragariae]|uniref:Uncharacterized protein n=1 Tax=Botrytis fragariae TaxID=1964551 RepID=A0A8H6AV81_9HELO|nr:uncharacterized protein Bfra_004097 [Botrytis fragariae]KAF5874090.1 hypothetical protein Bfra_004097 [Botrytis fragariae]